MAGFVVYSICVTSALTIYPSLQMKWQTGAAVQDFIFKIVYKWHPPF